MAQVTFRRAVRIGLAAAAGILIYRMRAVIADTLLLLLFSVSFAVILAPFCTAAERKGIPPAAASACSILLLVLSLVLLISMIVPYLIMQSIDLLKYIVPALCDLLDSFAFDSVFFNLSLAEKTGIMEMIASMIKKTAYHLAQLSFSIASKTGIFFFSLVTAYYVLRNRRVFCCHLQLCVPLSWRKTVLMVMQNCKNAVMGYLNAVVKSSAFVAAVTYPVLYILGVPNSLFLALLMGIFEVLPYIGPIIASVPILLSCLPLGMNTAAVVFILLIAIQQIEGNLITPYLTASSTSVHPLTVLIGVFVFGKVFGFIGILLAVPAIIVSRSVIWSLVRVSNSTNTQEMIET